MDPSRFRKELQECINHCCMESGSDTPDFILADYLKGCLELFNKTVEARGVWYGERKTRTIFNIADFTLSLFRRHPKRRKKDRSEAGRGRNPYETAS
jgi:hypothetical protein